MISENESKMIYILKAFAIISVVCAHISLVPDTFSKESLFVCTLLNEIGAIGVGIFFSISGYLFAHEKGRKISFKSFIFKKFTTIGIPWVISASLVYFYVAVRKGGSLKGWLMSVAGYMSSYWFLSVLFILYIIYFGIRNSKKEKIYLVILAGLSLVSVLLRYIGLIEQDSIGVYLNVFNWSIFFSFGYWLRKCDKKKLQNFFDRKKTFILTIISIVLIIILPMWENRKFSYFSFGYIPIELITIGACIGLARFLSERTCKGLLLIGKMSFSIYLYNELLWTGLIVNLGNKFDFWPLLFIRPIIVLGIVVGELLVGRWLFGLFYKTRLYDILTGVRV